MSGSDLSGAVQSQTHPFVLGIKVQTVLPEDMARYLRGEVQQVTTTGVEEKK